MAVLNRSNGKYFFLPGASRWNKQNWLSKYAAEEEKNRRDIYNPLYPGRVEPVPGRGVLVDGRFFDRNETWAPAFMNVTVTCGWKPCAGISAAVRGTGDFCFFVQNG